MIERNSYGKFLLRIYFEILKDNDYCHLTNNRRARIKGRVTKGEN